LDGTLLDSRQRQIVVLAECINQINASSYTSDDFYDFVSYKSEGNTGLAYLQNKEIHNAEDIFKLWIQKIEYKKYLRFDRLYPNVLNDLKTMNDRYNLFLLTARSNKPNAIWQLSELDLGDFFCEMIVVKNTGNVGLNKYRAIQSIHLDFVIGDTEIDFALAKYAKCSFIPLNYGFRSAQYWINNGLKSYNTIHNII
jgi:phosphoglycolate phosphatase-like HAD superfamily hydrolase